MNYHIEEIYKLAGRDNKVAVIEFIQGSESYNLYGPTITVVFVYSQFERERMERDYVGGSTSLSHAKVKARFLSGADLGDSSTDMLLKEGFNSEDIAVLYHGWDRENLFYESKQRKMRTEVITMNIEPKGGDYGWMYNITRIAVEEGRILNPDDRYLYLAMKFYFHRGEITPEEKLEILDTNGKLNQRVEFKFLRILIDREESTEKDRERYAELAYETRIRNTAILTRELEKVNMNIAKLHKVNPSLAWHLYQGTVLYTTHDLNVMGKQSVYLDWEGYLHVFLRHVLEYETGGNTGDKSKFLWSPKDVIPVMKKVIESIDEEIQAFWVASPGKRFSRFGDKTVHFEGDYYTIQIEGNGRLSTFHPSEKRI